VAGLPPELRTYRLIKMMQAPPALWEGEPAVRLDALLAIDNVYTQVAAEKQNGDGRPARGLSPLPANNSVGAGGYVE
jgi:hypothetical protein